jgi:DNA polymerase I-like protein with 3'-5' exonuclease and polymerase domains
LFGKPFFNSGGRKKANILPTIVSWEVFVVKSWPLGFIYGRGVPPVAGLPLTPKRSKEIFDDFHCKNPEINLYHAELIYQATTKGYIRTPFGRIRLFSNPKKERNEILSTPGQVTGVDVLYRNVLTSGINQGLKARFGGRLLFTVHDSAVCCADYACWREATEFITQKMEAPIPELDGWSIPVEAKVGFNWYDIMSVTKFERTGGAI